jgi:NAD(P)H-flavin reductase
MSIPRKIRCTVESITDHGGRVYTVDLVPANSVPSFRPGQFLHLTVDDYDPSSFWPESRVFSIASSPRDRSRIRICYSVKGRYTTKMEQVLRPGSSVWIKLPYGEFIIDDTNGALLVAGGTGISAFTAFIGTFMPEIPEKITLVYGARTPELLLFQEMILDQFAKVARLNVIFFTETPDDGFFGRMAALPRAPACFVGRISIDTVLRQLSTALCPPTSVVGSAASDLRPLISGPRPPPPVLCSPTSVFYLAGPPVMISALSAGLRTCGVGTERIRVDAWE